MEKDTIRGGYFQVARQIFESEIWLTKPSSWKVIWLYIIGNVNHKDTKLYKRGEGIFVFSRELVRIGNDITPDKIKKFLTFAKSRTMISTRRSTRGTWIKVLEYDKYQAIENYKARGEARGEALEKHDRSTPIYKNVKNDNKLALRAEEDSPVRSVVVVDTQEGARAAPDEPPKFSLEEELRKLKEEKRKDLRLVGYYIRRKNLNLPSKEKFRQELLRGLKEAKTLKDYPEKAILKAMTYCEQNYDIWTLETVGKIVPNIK